MTILLATCSPEELKLTRPGAPSLEVQQRANEIVAEVRQGGIERLEHYARELDGLSPGERLIYGRSDLAAAEASLTEIERQRLRRIASRIRVFAEAQRSSLVEIDVAVDGGRAGQRIQALEVAGCYAPAGAHPLPSSVLMTALPARVAGVADVWVASPRPLPILLAAASVAGADGFVAAGGAHAIAALAYGAGDIPAADIVVGPGNSWVTAAKRFVAGDVRIDGLAGPSELTILASEGADAEALAREVLAQAEHAEDAWVGVVATDASLLEALESHLLRLIETLPTASVIRESLRTGGATVVEDPARAVRLVEELAPEHLLLAGPLAEAVGETIRNPGTVFIGDRASVAFGDYGVGPNHTLPTGGAARGRGGLSVLDFLAVRTWLTMHESSDRQLVEDVAWLARQEGLEAHARAVEGAGR